MVTVPACQASLVLLMTDGGWPLISVPSGFTFARSWLTLKTMFPAGAATSPNVLAKTSDSPLRLTVSAVIVIEPDRRSAAIRRPPAVKSIPLLKTTDWAASVDSGRIPEMVRSPAGPAVLPA